MEGKSIELFLNKAKLQYTINKRNIIIHIKSVEELEKVINSIQDLQPLLDNNYITVTITKFNNYNLQLIITNKKVLVKLVKGSGFAKIPYNFLILTEDDFENLPVFLQKLQKSKVHNLLKRYMQINKKQSGIELNE